MQIGPVLQLAKSIYPTTLMDVPEPLDTRKINADDLRYLLAVATTGRLISAASALGVNHTTVARRIQALEKVLGERLLQRGADGWELTSLGRVVAERARPIEQALDQIALAAAGAGEDSLSGTFRVSAPDGFGTAFVVPALVKLREKHPNLAVELVTATRQLNLHQAGFDLAIAVGTSANSRLFTERLTGYSMSLYASTTYLARHGTPTTLRELADHTLIFYIDSMLQVGDLDLNRLAPGITARFATTNILAQLEATAAGAGIGLLPRFLAIRSNNLQRLSQINLTVPMVFTLAARRDSINRPATQAVREAIHREVIQRKTELIEGE